MLGLVLEVVNRGGTYPVDGNLLVSHSREVSILLEQVGHTHLLEIGDQIVVLLEFKLWKHHLTGPSGRTEK